MTAVPTVTVAQCEFVRKVLTTLILFSQESMEEMPGTDVRESKRTLVVQCKVLVDYNREMKYEMQSMHYWLTN